MLHTTAGYLLYAGLTHELVFDLKPDDVYFCAADIGWITGHSYIVYGPLANGDDRDVRVDAAPRRRRRYWRVVEDLASRVSTPHPAIRAVARRGMRRCSSMTAAPCGCWV